MDEDDLIRWEIAASEAYPMTPHNWPSIVLSLISEVRRLQHDLEAAVGYRLAAKETPKGEWEPAATSTYWGDDGDLYYRSTDPFVDGQRVGQIVPRGFDI